MICGTCRHDNQPNAKFCSECGTPLARRCPACDTEQAPAAKFCDECGTSLTATPPRAPAVASSPSASRKRVTALFADLVGSTSFAERVDPEAVRSSLAPYFDMLQSTIDDHAGSVVKFLGDGMLALFGVPEVAEDDALRAVAAGVELQRRFRSFADEIRERHGVELDLRVGVNTGELVIGADDADLVGDVLNTAARLEAACEPGRVLVGEDTWRLTRSNVTYEVLDEVRVKGKADAVATFQVVEHDDGAVGPSDDITVFVGRSDELDALGGVFADAVATSSARLATVIGSPGVGKTRLARELCARTEARSFDLRLERRGSTTFTPIADLLRAAAGSASIDAIEGFLEDHPEQDRLAPVLASFLGHGDARTTEESFWAVRRLLELLAADGPVIVVVDDIQWAEPLFWDLLDHLVEWTAAPVLLLALARPELRNLRPELTQPGRRVAASIALEGLDADTTLELAARLLGIDELPAELADRLPASTEGNPLFVRELVQMLVDDGVLARDGDRWRLTIDADAIEVPPTILSLLASRVERLPDDERQVVELASVIGTEFDRGTLDAIADAEVVGRLGAVIDRLRRKDLIEPSGQWSGDHPVYRFHHVLIRDAAYRRLLKAHRAELHEFVGRHVEASRAADDEVDIIVAHHFEQVYRYRSELGSLDDHTRTMATTAATRLRSAAELALDREDLSSAGNAVIRALQLLTADAGTDRDELLLIGCEALLSTGDATKAAPLVDELHGRSSDERLSAWADCFRAQMWSLTDAERLTEAAEVTADAAERLAAFGDDSGVAKARLVRASCLARLGRVGDCEAELDLALGAARAAGDRRRTVAVLGAAPLAALWGPSPVARAGGRCLDVLRLLRITSASPTVEATSIRCQGMLEALRGRFDSARAKLETSRATARELGLRHGLYETELFAGLVELFAGDAAAAEPHLRAARDGLGRLGIGADAGQASALLARSLLLQGRIAEADELATGALDTAGQNLQTAITAGAVLAEVRAAQGHHEVARSLVDDAISIASPTDVTLDHALTLLTAARVAGSAGDSATSHRRAAQAVELLDAKGVDRAIATSGLLNATGDGASSSDTRATADTRASNQSGQRLWNGVLDIVQRAVDRALANDRTALLAYLSSDFRGVHHGALAADFGWPPYGSAEEFADFLIWLLEHSESRQFTIDPLAVRGDRLAMCRSTTGSDAGVLDRLVVARSTDSAVIEMHFFDMDQLFDAIDELDRLWTDNDPSAVPRLSQLPGTRLAASLAVGDLEGVRSGVTNDFVALDHRQVGLGERHVDDWIESMAATTAGDSFVTIPADILMGDGHRVLSLLAVSVGDDTWHVLTITEVRDGLVSRIEHFDGDDLDAATARYRELAGQDEPGRRFTNTAWEIGLLADAAFHRRDDRGTLELLTPTFVAEWHHELATSDLEMSREVFVGTAAAIDRDDLVDRTTELLATRGDRLALVRATNMYTAATEVSYVLLESDESRLTRYDRFEEGKLDQALDQLDRRWLAGCGVPSDAFIVAVWPRTNTLQVGDLSDIVHADFEFTDHRSLRNDTDAVSFDEFVRRGWVETETWTLVTEVHRFEESGCVYTRVERNGDDEICIVCVAEQADGAVRRLDLFDPDDLDAALALFDGRQRASRSPDRAEVTPNGAYLIADKLALATVRRDRDAMLGLLADDFRSVPRTAFEAALGLSTPVARLETVDDLLMTYDEAHIGSQTRAILATRGDHLYLSTSTLVTDSGDELVLAVVGEADDTRLRSLTYYDESHLDEAVADLDRRYRLACGIGDDHWLAGNWSALTSPDAEAYEALLADDFRGIEHRPVRLGETDRNVLIAYVRATPPSTSWSIPVVYRLSDRGMVFEQLETWGDGAGDTRVLMTIEFGDGVIKRLDAYEPDDLDAALARYDEITDASDRPLTNGAWELVQRADTVRRSGDRDGYASLLADDIVVITYDPIMVAIDDDRGAYDKDRYLDAQFDPMIFGPTSVTEQELVAVRGDDLCLFHVRTTTHAGDVHERLVGVEVHSGVAIRIDVFPHDQLREAQTALDHRWLATLGFDDQDWIVQHWDLAYCMDFGEVAGMLHPDFEIFDHRPLHFPSGDAATLAETMGSLGHEVEVLIPRIHRISRSGAVVERIERAVGDVLGEEHQILVTHIVDEAIRRTDGYTVDDLPAALARFEESGRSPVRELTNAAWELLKQSEPIRHRGDRDGYGSLLADDIVVITYDPIMAAIDDDRGAYDKDRYLDALFDSFLPTSTTDLDLIAVRGDELCLLRTRTTTSEGDVHERLLVAEVHDGLCVRIDVYPHDQLGEAQITLDHAWLTSLGFADDHPFFELTGLFYHSDPTVIAPAFSEEFRYVEHRRLGFPDGDRSQLLVNANSNIEALEVVIPRYLRLTERLALGERIEQTVGGSAQMPGLYLTALGADGRIAYMEVFDVDDEEAAIACFDRLLAEERNEGSVLGPLTNAAWELVQEAQLVKVNDGHRERFASFFADDFVATTHDSIMAQANDGTIDKAHYVEVAFDPVFGLDSTQHIQLIAVRGDDRCLFRSRVTTPSGDLHERLNVLEVRDGLAVRIDVFPHDQLGAAQTALDRHWLTSLGFAADHPWFAVLDWYYDSDATVMARELPDDFHVVDHRRLTYPDGNRSQIVTNVSTRLGAVEIVVPRYHRVTDRTAFFEHIEQTVGGDEQSLSLMVSQLGSDGRIAHLEIFEIDDDAAAIACFDRLDADARTSEQEPEEPISVTTPLTNRAAEFARAFSAAYVAGDGDELGHLVDRDSDVEFRQHLNVVSSTAQRDFIEFMLASHAAANEIRNNLEIIAVRDECLCLALVDDWHDDDSLAYCLLVETDGERITHMIWFDDDQLIDAQLELDRRWLASTGQSGHWFELHWPLLYDPHPDAMFEFLATDFEYIDHRPLMFPSGDAELMRTTIASMEHDVVFTIPRFHRMSDAGGVFERVETAVGDVGETHVVFVNRFVDQRVRSIEAFDITQLDQALARYEEFTSD